MCAESRKFPRAEGMFESALSEFRGVNMRFRRRRICLNGRRLELRLRIRLDFMNLSMRMREILISVFIGLSGDEAAESRIFNGEFKMNVRLKRSHRKQICEHF